MIRSVYVISLTLLCVSVVGCQTLRGQKSDAQVAAEAPERGLPYPEQTRAVIRVHPERVAESVDRLFAQPEEEEAEEGDEEQEGPEEVADEKLSQFEELFGDVGEQLVWLGYNPALIEETSTLVDAPELEGLDTERAMVAAVSTKLADAYLERIEYHLPFLYRESMTPEGLSYRLFVPAEDEQTLETSLDEACEASEEGCEAVRRVDTIPGWVVADVGMPGAEDVEPAVGESAENDTGYFEQMTPATEAFLSPDTAAAVYSTGEDLVAIGALLSGGSHLWPGGGSTGGQHNLNRNNRRAPVFDALTPETREVEDAAAVISANETSRGSVEVYQTLTERGAEVSITADPQVALPQVELDASHVDVEFALDAEASKDGSAPAWLTEGAGSDDEPLQFDEFAWDEGFDFALSATMPYATAYGVTQTSGDDRSKAPAFADAVDGLIGLRAKVELRGEHEPPRAAAAFLVEPGSRAEDFVVELAHRLDDRSPSEWSTELAHERPDDAQYGLYTLTSGVDQEVFGAETDVDAGVSVAADLDSLGERVPSSASSYMSTTEFLLLVAMNTGMTRLDAEHRPGSNVATTRLAIDQQEDAAPAASSSGYEPGQPTWQRSECSRAIAAEARPLLDQVNDHASINGSHLKDLDEGLAALEGECEGSSGVARRLRADWWAYAGYERAMTYRFDAAHSLLARACEFGQEDDRSCGLSERTEQLADDFPLVKATPDIFGFPSGQALSYIGEDGLTRLPRHSPLSNEPRAEHVTSSPDAWLEAATEKPMAAPVKPYGEAPEDHNDPRKSIAYFGVGPTVQTARVRELIAELEFAPTNVDEEDKRQMLELRMKQNQFGYIGFLVDGREAGFEEQFGAVAFGDNEELAKESEDRVEISVTADGLRASADGEAIAVDEDCDGDMTVCVADADETAALLEKADSEAFETASSDAVDAFIEQYDLERLQTALEEADAADADATYEIVVDEATPFGLVAAVAGTVAEAAGVARSTDRVLDLYLRTK